MKKIGFIDYYISEWHANNYPSWISDACKTLGAEYEVAYAWAELDLSPKYNETTDEWCQRMGVQRCDTIEELCEKSDVILILAPSDPDKHLDYAQKALRYRKPTYIDKTFAPDLRTANKIIELAKVYGTPFFSTSALRYGDELDVEFQSKEVLTTGSGSSIDEYIIHQIEMVVRLLGVGAQSICARTHGSETVFFIKYADGRSGSMIFAPSIPFTVYISGEGAKPVYKKVESPYFVKLMEDIIRFYESGEPSFDTAQTVEVMRIREGAILAAASEGSVIELSKLKV